MFSISFFQHCYFILKTERSPKPDNVSINSNKTFCKFGALQILHDIVLFLKHVTQVKTHGGVETLVRGQGLPEQSLTFDYQLSGASFSFSSQCFPTT